MPTTMAAPAEPTVNSADGSPDRPVVPNMFSTSNAPTAASPHRRHLAGEQDSQAAPLQSLALALALAVGGPGADRAGGARRGAQALVHSLRTR